MNTRMKKLRDEMAEAYPRIYELQFMNADTPRLSGQHYMIHGYQVGFNAAAAIYESRENKLIEALDKIINRWDNVGASRTTSYLMLKEAIAAYKAETEAEAE